MKCPDSQDWIRISLLPPDEANEVRSHAASCVPCAALLLDAAGENTALLRLYAALDDRHDELRQRLLTALNADNAGAFPRAIPQMNDVPQPARSRLTFRLRRPIAAILTAAACIAFAALAFFHSGDDALALADVVQRLEQVRAMVCRQRIVSVAHAQETLVQEARLYQSAGLGMRYDLYHQGKLGTVGYIPTDGPMVYVNPEGKTYTRIRLEDRHPPSRAALVPEDHLKYLRHLTGDADRRLGAQTIEDRVVEGFEIDGRRVGMGGLGAEPNAPPAAEAFIRVWVDVATRLPVQYVVSQPGDKPGAQTITTQDQYQWDADVDPALFAVPPPEPGYAVIEIVQPALNETSLVTALRKYADLTGGTFPERIDRSLAADLMERGLLKLDDSAGPHPAPMQTLFQAQYALDVAWHFTQRLQGEGRKPEYFGSSVRLGDAKAVLLRWRTDSGVRIVYGDLRIDTSAADGRP